MCSSDVMQKVAEEISRRRLLTRAGLLAGASLGGVAVGPAQLLAQDASPTPVEPTPTTAATPELEATPEPAAAGLPCNLSQMVDLTHLAGPDFPMFPGANPMQIDVLVTVAGNGFYKNQLTLDEHTGTHMDAPAHFIEGGAFAGDIPVTQLLAPLCVVHIHEKAASDPDAQVTLDDLTAWESQFGPLPEGAFVAMHSGWESRVGDEASYRNTDGANVMHFPGFHPDAAAMLVNERNIVGIGVDTMSLDFGASSDFATHVTVLGAGKFGVENLANLAQVPPSGAFIIVGGPKHETASGGPARTIALVP